MSTTRSRPRSRSRSLPRIGPHSNGMSMTVEEFDAIENYDDCYRYELIRGVLIVSPIPSAAEADPNGELEFMLRTYRRSHPQGESLDATLCERYVHLAESRRRPDRAIWAGLGRVPDLERDVPAIVVEFVSKSKRDRVRDYVEKRQEYLDLGIREYWIIDRFQRFMTVIRPDQPDLIVKETEIYQTPLLPGFELPLAEIFKAAARWTKKRS